LAAAKAELRRLGIARRSDAKTSAGRDAAEQVADLFFAALPVPRSAAISGYWPIREELDPRPLMHRLYEAGHGCGLPVVVGPGQPLVFRAWYPGATLEAAGFGVSVPPRDAAEVVPTLLLVPLLAFDERGYRLGYGGGFYDRTLARLRRDSSDVLAVGLAYSGQQVETVPTGPGDQRLDWVVTEEKARKIE
jgi:5-formyltetrahydrofolate cyclo-ligase